MEDSPEYKATLQTGFTFKSFLLIVLVNIIMSSASLYVYDRYFAQKVVAFDIKGYIAEQKRLFYKGKITEDELLGGLDKVDAFLTKESKNTLILNGEAVIKNAKFIKP